MKQKTVNSYTKAHYGPKLFSYFRSAEARIGEYLRLVIKKQLRDSLEAEKIISMACYRV